MSSSPVEKLEVHSNIALMQTREAFEHCFTGTLISMDPDILAMDPAERLEFSRLRSLSTSVVRFDRRSDAVLCDEMFNSTSALERERAAWEYADRRRIQALPIIRKMLLEESSREVRAGLLWLVQKYGGLQALPILKSCLCDDDLEVGDWAKMILMECEGTDSQFVLERPTKRDPDNPFDQTLPLVIAGYARTFVLGTGWVQATLSPLWFNLILGRVMACTCDDTFESDLIIEKRLKEYHPDKSDHFEIFHFRGFSHPLGDRMTHHQYESASNHTFYPSGKVEDLSQPPVGDMIVNLARVAMTLRIPDPSNPGKKVVHSVRGRYMGWAYIDLPRVVAAGMSIGAGEVQLSSLHHPSHGHFTNTFLYGSFKGKLSDLDDDGKLDVNTERCHGTLDGRLDYELNGTGCADPYDPLGKF